MGVVNTAGGPIFVADSKPALRTQQMLQLARHKTLQDFRDRSLDIAQQRIDVTKQGIQQQRDARAERSIFQALKNGQPQLAQNILNADPRTQKRFGGPIQLEPTFDKDDLSS